MRQPKTLLLALLLAGRVEAQQVERSVTPPAVTANAEAIIAAEPDQAEIDIGVITQARTAPDAARENAEKLTRVRTEIKKLLDRDDELRTVGYSLNPNYRYPREGGRPEITGYTAANTVRIRTANLQKVGRLIDAAMQAGANAINRLAFTLKDEQGAQLRALRLAAQKARAKAEEMASALGLKIVRVLSVTEVERGMRPVIPQARGVQVDVMAAQAPTPIEAGTVEVRSTVQLKAEIAPR
ncbi:MAG TPA: SIMPL domain-containing protein [candidate division Zixibacteria bacterium]|nr:SIMPL domain-containing protein [candidate division Zixibacteria bacterium]